MKKSGPELNKSRIAIVNALNTFGTVEDKVTGRATNKLFDLVKNNIKLNNPTSLSTLLGEMEKDGQVVRDKGTKRTYAISLGPNYPRGWIRPNFFNGNGPKEEVAESTSEQTTSPPAVVDLTARSEPEPIQVDYVELADSLLLRMVEILQRPEQEAGVKDRLASTLEYSQKLRDEVLTLTHRVREKDDTIKAKDHEIRGLRERIATLDHNVKQLKKEQGRVISNEISKGLDRVMRQKPTEGNRPGAIR